MSNLGKAPTPTDAAFESLDSNSSAAGGQEVDREKDQSDKQQEVLQGHLALIRKEVARVRESRKIFLRRHLEKLRERTQKDRETGVDPLNVFPEEVWRVTLGFVKEPKDLDNSAKTCQLFQNILKDTNSERLFGKAFPLVAQYLSERRTEFYDAIQSCRLVCKQWRSHVDRFLEEADHRIHHAKYTRDNKLERYLEEEPNPLFKPISFPPIHFIDLSRSQEGNEMPWEISNADRESMKLHPGNPIVGRNVHITAAGWDPEDRQTFSQEFTHFLNDFGQHLYHLSLSTDDGFVFESPSQYLSTVVQCLAKCPNLKSLEQFPFGLDDMNEEHWYTNNILDSSAEEVRQLELPDHQFLETLRCGSTPPDPVGMLTDKLVGKYSGQLMSLELYSWNSQLYSPLPWQNLRHLDIHRRLSSDVRDSLMSISAPSLQRLDISLRAGGPGLKELLELLNHFPNLDHLELNLSGSIGESEIIKVSPGLAASSTSLTTVKIDLRFSSVDVNISYDFLVCFPFLKVLALKYYCLGGDEDIDEEESDEEVIDEEVIDEEVIDEEESDEEVIDEEESDEEVIDEEESDEEDIDKADIDKADSDKADMDKEDNDKEDIDESPDEKKSSDNLLKISKYLCQDPENAKDLVKFYRSNVWEILPSLEIVEMLLSSGPEPSLCPYPLITYTRRGYNARNVAVNGGGGGMGLV